MKPASLPSLRVAPATRLRGNSPAASPPATRQPREQRPSPILPHLFRRLRSPSSVSLPRAARFREAAARRPCWLMRPHKPLLPRAPLQCQRLHSRDLLRPWRQAADQPPPDHSQPGPQTRVGFKPSRTGWIYRHWILTLPRSLRRKERKRWRRHFGTAAKPPAHPVLSPPSPPRFPSNGPLRAQPLWRCPRPVQKLWKGTSSCAGRGQPLRRNLLHWSNLSPHMAQPMLRKQPV
jgi:hypothetical protein